MSDFTEVRHEEPKSDTDVGLPGEKSDTEARAERLRQALRQGGGNKAVSERSGVPKTTLDGYLRGGEIKLSNALALAAATGVRLEWLATGAGPMRAEQLAAAGQAATGEALSVRPAVPLRLAGRVQLDRLVRAYHAATVLSAGMDDREKMRFTLVLYDQLSEAAELQETRTE